MVIGPAMSVSVTISCINAISSFIDQTTDEQKLILIAKLFPILMRRLDDTDLRIARTVPPAMMACHRCSGDFLSGRIYGTLFPRLIELLNRRSGSYMSYSAEYKFIDSILEYFVSTLPSIEITQKRLELWKTVDSAFKNSKLKNHEFKPKLEICNNLMTEKWNAYKEE